MKLAMYACTDRSIITLLGVLLVILSVLPKGGECNYRQKRIVGGTTAKPYPVDDPVVFVTKDDREARVYGTRDNKTGYYLFRGIRYAEPPVGNRRFQVRISFIYLLTYIYFY